MKEIDKIFCKCGSVLVEWTDGLVGIPEFIKNMGYEIFNYKIYKCNKCGNFILITFKGE
jgi:hypothetical protein